MASGGRRYVLITGLSSTEPLGFIPIKLVGDVLLRVKLNHGVSNLTNQSHVSLFTVHRSHKDENRVVLLGT